MQAKLSHMRLMKSCELVRMLRLPKKATTHAVRCMAYGILVNRGVPMRLIRGPKRG